MIDAHCHLDSPELGAPVEAVVQQATEAGVTDLVMAGTDPSGWRRQSELARRFVGVWPVYGLHPWWAGRCSEQEIDHTLEALERACRGDKHVTPVAVGETGLDGSRLAPPDSLRAQEASFRAHLALARRLEKPIVLHILKAHDKALAVLTETGISPAGGLVHSFSGSAEIAARYQRLGLHISFSASITRPQSRRLRRAAASVQADRLLIETDAPDQPPHGHRQGPNRPALLGLVAKSVAQARGTSATQIQSLTSSNAKKLFGLP